MNKVQKEVKLFFGMPGNVADALRSYLRDKKMAPGHIDRLDAFTSEPSSTGMGYVTLVLRHLERHADDKATEVASLAYVHSNAGVGILDQDFEKKLNLALPDVGDIRSEVYVRGQGFLTWYAIHHK